MAKAENKTTATSASVRAFLDAIPNPERRADAKALDRMLRKITGKKPKLWGPAIVGYGEYHYRYASGREGDFLRIGFSPRAQNLTLYIMPGYENFDALLATLGPYTKGKSCLYVKRLADLHLPTLKHILTKGYRDMQKLYPENA